MNKWQAAVRGKWQVALDEVTCVSWVGKGGFMEGVRLGFAWKGQLYLDRIKIKQTDISCFLPFNWQMKP